MTTLARRTWALEYGKPGATATIVEGISLQFKTSATTTTITAFLPSASLVESLGQSGVVWRLLAGYEDTGAVEVARGTVVKGSIQDELTPPDARITWQISRTSAELQLATVARSWASCHASDVIEYIRQAMAVPAGIIELADDIEYVRGYVLQGAPKPYLDSVVADCGCQWEIDGGRLKVWPLGGEARQTSDVWAPSTGLLRVSSPDGDGRIQAIALLRPALRKGDVVRLESRRRDGELIVREVSHQGDTRGDVWYTQIVGVVRG